MAAKMAADTHQDESGGIAHPGSYLVTVTFTQFRNDSHLPDVKIVA